MADALLTDEQVLGVKHTSHNLYSLERMTATYPEKVFFNGFDEIYLSALAAGATVNVQPELFMAVREAFRLGKMPQAQALQQKINTVVAFMVERGIFQAAKYLAGRNLTELGPVREPFTPLTARQKKELDGLYQRIQETIAHGNG